MSIKETVILFAKQAFYPRITIFLYAFGILFLLVAAVKELPVGSLGKGNIPLNERMWAVPLGTGISFIVTGFALQMWPTKKKSYLELKSDFDGVQHNLLTMVVEKSKNGEGLRQDDLERMNTGTGNNTELYYRMEQLYLKGFIDKQGVGHWPNTSDPMYQLGVTQLSVSLGVAQLFFKREIEFNCVTPISIRSRPIMSTF